LLFTERIIKQAMKNIEAVKRDLMISGAFREVSIVIDTLDMEEWMHDKDERGGRFLDQCYSPYLPSTFYDEFGEEEPTEKELLKANLSNFIESISAIKNEIANTCSSYGAFYHEKIAAIQICMEDELKEVEKEISMESEINKDEMER